MRQSRCGLKKAFCYVNRSKNLYHLNLHFSLSWQSVNLIYIVFNKNVFFHTHSSLKQKFSFFSFCIINDVLLVYVPNAFTPNGDYVNNEFMPIISGIDVLEYEFFIFNRWGELIYESYYPGYGWDGTYMGKIAQQDAYIWKLVISLEDSQDKREYVGHVLLIK